MLRHSKMERGSQKGVVVARGSQGMVTVLFAAVILPLIFIMLTVTVELAHFFGIREELRQVLDREARDSLVQGLTEAEVIAGVRQRMRNVDGMAAITNIRYFRSAARSAVEARAEYRGAFFQFIQAFTGQERAVLPMTLRSQVRIQTAASFILVDRAVTASSDPCDDDGLQAMGSFVDRLVESWSEVAEARVVVGVTPGETEIAPGVVSPVELLTNDGSDDLPRCNASSGSPFNVSGLRGSVGTPFDGFDIAYAVQELAVTELIGQDREVRNIVLILRRERYDQGVAQSVLNLLQQSARDLPFSLDMYVVVVDGTGTIDSRPLSVGINGGVYRELGASNSELEGVGLLGAMTQTVTDRIVLEN